jgi:hypothetical protein
MRGALVTRAPVTTGAALPTSAFDRSTAWPNRKYSR